MRELTLHMADRDNMGEPKYARYDGPDAVVTLRPWPSKKKHRPRIGAIFYARDAQAANAFEGGPRAPWDGRYHLDGGVFVGEVIATSDSLAARWSSPGEHRMICNLDGSAFNRLELRRGQRLSVSIAGRNYTVLSLGRWHPKRAEAFLGKRAYAGLADRHPRLLVGFLSGTRIIGEPGFVATYHEYGVPYRWHDYFVVGTLSPDSEGYRAEDASFQTIFRAQPGSPVRLSVEPAPFFGVDASWRDAWKAEGRALHARVVSCTEAALFLNIDRRALAQIGFADGDVLELRIGDLTRTIYDKKYIAARDWLDIMERITRPRPESQAARAAEIEKMLYDESGRIRPEDELPTGPDLLRELNRLEFHPDDLAAPPLTLDFVENLDVEGWMMTALTSALRTTVFDPDDIHIDVPPDTPVTLAPAQ